MFFFVMLFLMFAFMRLAHRGRYGFARLHCGHHHYRHRRMRLEPPAPKLSPFERLKQRYVNGDLSDEQYEDELDKLLRGGGATAFDSRGRGAGASA